MKSSNISNKEFLWLFIICPLSFISQYFQQIIFGSIPFHILTFNYVLLLIFIYYTFKKPSLNLVLLSIYLLLIIFLLGIGDYQTKATSAIRYIVTIASFLFFSKINIQIQSLYRNRIFLAGFVYLFVLTYYYSVFFLYTGTDEKNLWTNASGDILYLQGFIIPHSFAFFCAVSALMLNAVKYRIHALIILLAGFYAGTRTGFMLNAMTLFYIYRHLIFNIKIKSLLKNSFILILLVSIFIIIINLVPNNPISNTFTRFTTTDGNITSNSDAVEKFSSGRTMLWLLAYNEISTTFFSMSTLFGHGPLGSLDLIGRKTGLPLWFHNDFIEIIYAYGLWGLFLYLYAANIFYKRNGNSFLFMSFFLISATFNGFYSYLNIPLMITISLLYNEKNSNSMHKGQIAISDPIL